VILVYLEGGLGNQLFQYAAGRALADFHQASLKLVIRGYSRFKESRIYKLHHYNIAATVATSRQEWLIRLSNPLRYLGPWHQRPRIVERRFRFNPEILAAPDNVCLAGHWQSEKYFLAIESILHHEFTLKNDLDGENLRFSRLISQTSAVSLHIRRGDYVSDPAKLAFHGCCPPDYYRAAIDQMRELVDSPHLFVFSDDLDWAERHLVTGCPTTFVRHNGEARDYEDLRLMSQCQHHIIANSSFSWWGAWLCKNPGKQVIAPKNWFDGAKNDTSDLIPASWMQL